MNEKTTPASSKAWYKDINTEDDHFHLYNKLIDRENGQINFQNILDILKSKGIDHKDPRLRKILEGSYANDKDLQKELHPGDLKSLFENSSCNLLEKALKGELIIPNFEAFTQDIEELFEATKPNLDGTVADTLPHPKTKRDPAFAVSICTVDGQLLQLGDHHLAFSVQSISKAINYAIARKEVGKDTVHNYVGFEPGDENFETGTIFNENNLPHNPLINSGAINTATLIKPKQSIKKRLAYVKSVWEAITGDKSIGYNEEAFEGEWKNAHRNMAFTHLMRHRGILPEDVSIKEAVAFYLQCCSLKVNIDDLAHAAATMANYGTCPTTGKDVFSHDIIRDTLSLMLSSGTYDYSGEFTFRVGLPVKSGISGGLMVVVPNVMGISIYSPPLDKHLNSVRGVEFCQRLVDRFNFHQFDSMNPDLHKKKDPRK